MAIEDQNIKITVDSNFSKATQDSNKLASSLDKMEDAGMGAAKSMKNLDATFEEVYGDLQPLTTRMGEAEDRLYELALAGQTAGQEYKDLLQNVANYRKTQIETDRVVDAAATTLGQKLGGAAQIAATGVQGVTAGMALFGDQSEDTEKALLKVQAAMAFADAISSVSTLGGQWRILKSSVLESSIATKANTAATGAAAVVQKLFTGSVTTTTVGFKALKFAIAATGIGLLVVGLVAVYQNFEKISKFATNLIPGLAGVGKMIGNIVNSITDFIGVTSEADRAIDRIKSNADQSLELNKKFLAEHGDQLNEFTRQKIDAKNRYNEAVKEDGADQIALAKRLNRELAAIEYSRGDEARAIQKENAEKAAEEAEKRRQEAKDKAKADAEAAKELANDEFKANQELQKDLADKDEEDYKNSQEEKQKRDEEDAARQIANWEYLANEKQKIDEFLLRQELFKEEKKKEIAEKGIGFLNVIAGKNKAIQKAAILAEGIVSVARSIKNTIAGNAGALANSILTLGPIAGPPAAAPAIALNTVAGSLSVATTVAQTAKALQALGGGGSVAGGGSGGGVSVSGSAPPSVAFNNSAENQIGQSVSRVQADQPPILVSVLESDITNAQNNVNVLVEKNKF